MGDHPWMLQTRASTASYKMVSREYTYSWTRAYIQIPKLFYVQCEGEVTPYQHVRNTVTDQSCVILRKNYCFSKQEQFAYQGTFPKPGSWHLGPEKKP